MSYKNVVSVAISAVAAACLVIVTSSLISLTVTSIILIVSITVAVFGLSMVIGNPKTKPIAFTCYMYMIFYYLLPGLTHQWIKSYPFFGFKYDEWAEIEAALICLCFVSVFTAVVVRSAPAARLDAVRDKLASTSLFSLNTSSIAITLIALVCGLIVGYHPFTDRSGLEEFGRQSPGELILSAVTTVGSFLAVLIAIKAIQLYRLKGILPLIVAIGPFLAANSPISLPRYVIGSEALTFTFLFMKPRQKGKVTLLAALVFAQFSVFPLLSDISRQSNSYEMRPFTYISTNGDFDGFQSTINVVHYVETSGFKNGKQIASAILFFVPRSWWPTKSGGLGGDAAEYEGYPFINISSPLPSEAFADFGFFGLFPMALAFAWFANKLDAIYERSRRGGDWARLLVPSFTSGYTFILFRGALVGTLGPFVCSILLAQFARQLLAFTNVRRR